MESAWAQLVSVTEMESPEIPLIKDKFVIGRNSDCDLPHAGNKLVSGKHCYIERDKNGKVWLYDTSTNGTLLNLSIKLTKGECRELHHGDEIHVVHKKNDTTDDIGYMFQDMEALKAGLSSDYEDTQEYTPDMNELDSTLADEEVNTVTTPSPLKKRKSIEISPAVNKRIKIDSALVESSSVADDEKKEKKITAAAIDTPDTVSDKTEKISSSAEAKQMQDEVSEKAEGETKQGPAEKPVVPQEPKEDAIAETLVCIICQELLYDCISLQPCMHSFCAGCYSEWMERSQECPSCRVKVARINKNHIVNNLVEAYLQAKPDMRRPEADIKELDGKNKITRDMLYPARKLHSDDESLSDSYTDDDDDDEHNSGNIGTEAAAIPLNNFNNPTNFNNFNLGGVAFGFHGPFYGNAPIVPAQTFCRQCLGNKTKQNEPAVKQIQPVGVGATDGAVAGPSTTAGPSAVANDPDVKTFPSIPDYTCLPHGNHILCLCCLQPMPDRRYQHVNGVSLPPQQCVLCSGYYCHAYWGCQKADCNGCLAQFKDLNFGKKCLTSIVLDNHYESKVLADYIKGLGMSVKDLFKECLNKVDTGEYTFTYQARLTPHNGWNTPVCYGCGFRAFKELAYNYRRDIPADRLPQEVTSRPNCYWGKNCRTQRNRPEHAIRLNHICEQSRTTI